MQAARRCQEQGPKACCQLAVTSKWFEYRCYLYRSSCRPWIGQLKPVITDVQCLRDASAPTTSPSLLRASFANPPNPAMSACARDTQTGAGVDRQRLHTMACNPSASEPSPASPMKPSKSQETLQNLNPKPFLEPPTGTATRSCGSGRAPGP